MGAEGASARHTIISSAFNQEDLISYCYEGKRSSAKRSTNNPSAMLRSCLLPSKMRQETAIHTQWAAANLLIKAFRMADEHTVFINASYRVFELLPA